MKIHIREPWWSAWQTFDWEKGTWGVGISKASVDYCIKSKESLEITVGKSDEVHELVPETVATYPTVSAKGVQLYVIPRTLLE